MVFRNKRYWISILICLFLFGCTSNNTKNFEQQAEDNPSKVDQILQENADLKKQVEELQKVPSETFMMDLRETMNLSFKVIQAMESHDYSLLESVSGPGVIIDRERNQVVFTYDGEEIRWNFLKGIHLGNLEYWGSRYAEADIKFQIVFAHFFEDTHGTIYIDFIKEDNRWLFNGFVTNA